MIDSRRVDVARAAGLSPNAEPRGIGLGLRASLCDELFARLPEEVRWVEIHPENYIGRGGRYRENLERALATWPVITHGLTCGFGGTHPIDATYQTDLARFLEAVRTPWHSDHLCWAGAAGIMLHDLLPVPFDRDTARHAAERVRHMRSYTGKRIAIENVSQYMTVGSGSMSEAEFLTEVVSLSDGHLLLDVNNVYVNARNHGFDAHAFIDALPLDRVLQIHVAGHALRNDGLRIDTHAERVCEDVYALFEHTLRKIGRPLPVLLERDDKFPPLGELLEELRRLDQIYESVLGSGDARP